MGREKLQLSDEFKARLSERNQQSKRDLKREDLFAQLPHHLFRPYEIAAPTASLSSNGFRLLINLVSQYNGFNNGDLTVAPEIMKAYGWRSRANLRRATVELLALGFIEQTRQGGRNKCSLYAKRRAKLSRVLGKRALKSFHPRLFNDRLFAGETWSDKNGCTTRNQATAFC